MPPLSIIERQKIDYIETQGQHWLPNNFIWFIMKISAEVAKLADAQDLKSWGNSKARPGSSPGFGTCFH